MKKARRSPAGLWEPSRQLNIRATGRGPRTCTERSTERTQRTVHRLRLYLSFLTLPPPQYPLAFPPPPICLQRMGPLMRRSLSPWTPERRCFLKVRIYSGDRNRKAATQHCVWLTILHLGICVFQCLCSETGNSSIFLLLKALQLNSVILHPANSPYPLSQSETAARRDRSDTRTCSGRPSQTGRQTLDQTAFRTSATRTSTLITWASTSAWRSCRHFIPQRRTASLPGRSWRPTHAPQTETTWVPWRGHRHHPLPRCPACATWG